MTITKEERLEIFAPILAMGNGKDLANGPLGAAIGRQYSTLLNEYHKEVVREAVVNSCQGREFRPSPGVVRDHCIMVLERLAELFIQGAQRMIPWSAGEREEYLALEGQEQWSYWKEKWTTALGVKHSDWVMARTPLAQARMIRGWRKVELRAPETIGDWAFILERATRKAVLQIESPRVRQETINDPTIE